MDAHPAAVSELFTLKFLVGGGLLAAFVLHLILQGVEHAVGWSVGAVWRRTVKRWRDANAAARAEFDQMVARGVRGPEGMTWLADRGSKYRAGAILALLITVAVIVFLAMDVIVLTLKPSEYLAWTVLAMVFAAANFLWEAIKFALGAVRASDAMREVARRRWPDSEP